MGAKLRSLFHLQVSRNVLEALSKPKECIRDECYKNQQINTCMCSFCHPYEEEE